jgi:predicted lipase
MTTELVINWTEAVKYAELVVIAKAIPQTGITVDLQNQIQTLGYKYQQTLYGSDLATDIHPQLGPIVPFGFMAISSTKELVIAIRGTDSVFDWLHDLSFLMVPCEIYGMTGLTDDGFTSVYRSLSVSGTRGVKGFVDDGTVTSITVCGHSLGAAIATQLAVDIAKNTSCKNLTCYTFASPRVGDHIFASEYDKAVPVTYRIANRLDIVTQLPEVLPLPYEHVNTKNGLVPSSDFSFDVFGMHYLTTYILMMSLLAGTKLSLRISVE